MLTWSTMVSNSRCLASSRSAIRSSIVSEHVYVYTSTGDV